MVHTVADVLAATARRTPDGVALVHAGSHITWAALDTRVSAFAYGARERGLRAGDRVALVLANRTEFVVAHYGAIRAGLVSVPINPQLTSHELAQRTHDTAPSLVICDASSEVAVREALMTNQIGTSGVIAVGSPGWGDLVRPDRAAMPATAPAPESIALLMFTAGTDGRARAAMLSHRAMLAAVEQFGALDPQPVAHDDTMLLSLPLVDPQALNGLLGLAVSVGATVVLERRLDPDDAFSLLEREGVSVVAAAPSLFTDWTSRPEVAQALRGVRLIASGQAAMSPAVSSQLLTLTGQRVWEGYGMVEATAVITSTSGLPSSAGSVGRALPGIELRVLDVDGDDVDEGDPGEVMVRGTTLFSGFWPDGVNGPGPDGWFDTRDVAYLDDDGDLHLVDRRHDLIVVNGFPVYPREVELVIAMLDAVAECAVVGVDHPSSGQAVMALVVAVPDSGLSADEVLVHCSVRLARFKRPTIVEFVDQLPHVASGAIERHRLRSLR